eukprot:CFRG1179T1
MDVNDFKETTITMSKRGLPVFYLEYEYHHMHQQSTVDSISPHKEKLKSSTMAVNIQENAAGEPSWASSSLRKQCECQRCLNGEETTHNDESHDQSLQQNFNICEKNVYILGGTTKCARIVSRWLTQQSVDWSKISAIELGSGTALVGITLSLLGCKSVTFTDQEPVLDTIRLNTKRNLSAPTNTRVTRSPPQQDDEPKWQIEELFWGTQGCNALVDRYQKHYAEQANKTCPHYWDMVVGSDLIFAHENIPPLVKTYEFLCGPTTKAYLVTIQRFDWEAKFFELMSVQFDENIVHKEGDITIHCFTRKQ